MIVQLVALRQMNQLFGVGSASIAAALSMALGGLATGAWWFGARADHQQRPFAVGSLFFVAGVLAVLAVFAPSAFQSALISRSVDGPMDAWAFNAMRMLYALIAVFAPCIMLGGVLPTLVAWAKPSRVSSSAVYHRLGLLYGAETLGAAAGALFAGAWAIQILGLHFTLLATAIWSITLGSLVLAVSFMKRGANNLSRPSTVQASEKGELLRNSVVDHDGRNVWLCAVALAGCASLAMEVLWTRLLILVVGSDAFSYAIVSASYLIGIGVGASLVALLRKRIRRAGMWFAFLQIGVAVASVVQLLGFENANRNLSLIHI